MQIYPTQEKIMKLQEMARLLKNGDKKVKSRTVAKMIGIMVSNTIGNEYGNNHYRWLELDKINALAMNRGNYDKIMSISEKAKMEIGWWLQNIHSGVKNIRISAPKLIMKSDASNTGWGACSDRKDISGRMGLS